MRCTFERQVKNGQKLTTVFCSIRLGGRGRTAEEERALLIGKEANFFRIAFLANRPPAVAFIADAKKTSKRMSKNVNVRLFCLFLFISINKNDDDTCANVNFKREISIGVCVLLLFD